MCKRLAFRTFQMIAVVGLVCLGLSVTCTTGRGWIVPTSRGTPRTQQRMRFAIPPSSHASDRAVPGARRPDEDRATEGTTRKIPGDGRCLALALKLSQSVRENHRTIRLQTGQERGMTDPIKPVLAIAESLTRLAIDDPDRAAAELLPIVADPSEDDLERALLVLVLALGTQDPAVRRRIQAYWYDSSPLVSPAAILATFLRPLDRPDDTRVVCAWAFISVCGALNRDLGFAFESLNFAQARASLFEGGHVRPPTQSEIHDLIMVCNPTDAVGQYRTDLALGLLPGDDPAVVTVCQDLWLRSTGGLAQHVLFKLTALPSDDRRLVLEAMLARSPSDRAEEIDELKTYFLAGCLR